jgi:formate-dependent nitrite reductase membrane component NrfD
LSGLNAARQVVEDGFIDKNSLPGKLALGFSNPATQLLQGLDGLALGTYTGVLLSATAVPLWANADEAIAPLFLSSAFSTGAAAISLSRALAGVDPADLHRLNPIEQAAILSELTCLAYGFSKLTPEVRRHVTSGPYAASFKIAIGLGMVGPLLLQLVSPKRGGLARLLTGLTSAMVLTGGFVLRYAVIEAGKATADDSEAYHSITGGKGRATPQEQAQRYTDGQEKPFAAGRATPEQLPLS